MSGKWESFIEDKPNNRKEYVYRNAAFRLSILLSDSQEEAMDLLEMAGYCPNERGSKTDKIMMYIIENNDYPYGKPYNDYILDHIEDNNRVMNNSIVAAEELGLIEAFELGSPRIAW